MPPDIIDSEVAPQVTSTSTADSPDSQSATSAQTAPDTGSQQTAASPAAQTAPTNPAQAAAGQAAGAATSPAAPAAPFNFRDFAASQGIDAARTYTDDQSFAQAVLALAQTQRTQLAEAQRMAQYGQLWLQHQATQQAPATAPADPLAQYKAPQFDPRWEKMLIADPATGEIKLAPNADPSILPKFHAFQQHRENVFRQIAENPVEYFKPLVAHMIAEQGKQLIEGRLGQMQEQQYSENFIQQNRAWLFARNAAGQEIINPATNQPIMAPQGQRFVQYMQAAKNAGATTSQAQEWIARLGMAAEANMAGIANQQAVQTGQQQQQGVLNNMNRNPNAGGSLLGTDQTGHQAPAQQNPGLSLRDQLLANTAQMTDAEFAL